MKQQTADEETLNEPMSCQNDGNKKILPRGDKSYNKNFNRRLLLVILYSVIVCSVKKIYLLVANVIKSSSRKLFIVSVKMRHSFSKKNTLQRSSPNHMANEEEEEYNYFFM